MSQTASEIALWKLGNRLAAWRAGSGGPEVRGFRFQPEPYMLGRPGRAANMIADKVDLRGYRLVTDHRSIWDMPLPGIPQQQALHGWGWLADLAASGRSSARRLAQLWASEWIDRYGSGAGPGWTPAIAAERLIHILSHAPFLMSGWTGQDALFATIGRQLKFLELRHRATESGVFKLQLLTSWVAGCACFKGAEARLQRSVITLTEACRTELDDTACIPDQGAEALADIFCRLVWLEHTLTGAGHTLPTSLRTVIAKAAEHIRTVRLGSGILARHHGPGITPTADLDHALAIAKVRNRPGQSALGIERLHKGRSVLLMNGSTPARTSRHNHASALSISFSSGFHTILTSLGDASLLGADGCKHSRHTRSHNSVTLGEEDSAQFSPITVKRGIYGAQMQRGPSEITIEREQDDGGGLWLTGTHDGYVSRFGAMHGRQIFLSSNGSVLSGEDVITAPDTYGEKRLSEYFRQTGRNSLNMAAFFHFAPDITSTVYGPDILLSLENGEIWRFVLRSEGAALSLEDEDRWFDTNLVTYCATKRAVVTSEILKYPHRIQWELRKDRAAPRMTAAIEGSLN